MLANNPAPTPDPDAATEQAPFRNGPAASPGSRPTPVGRPGIPAPPPAIPDHELLRLIGFGSYGDVWLARNVMGTFRAVKVVYRERFDNDRPYEREFEGIRKFEPISRTHESQVDVLHIGRDDAQGYFYYVMELADDAGPDGEKARDSESETHAALLPQFPTPSPSTYVPRTLRLEMQRRSPLPVEECLQLGLALTTALEHLHRYGLIHRDIKPSNIIFVNGLPKLADIGLVTETDKTMSLVGTAGYLPPEGPGTVQGDIYSLGKVLYEACTGKDRQEFPELPTGLGALTDEENLLDLNEILIRACHHDARKRYGAASELRSDLELLRTGKSIWRMRQLERRLNVAKRSILVACAVAALATSVFLLQRVQMRAAQRNLYIANMNLAQRDWDKANPVRLSQLLNETEGFSDKGFEWYFWQRQLHLDLRTIRGHRGEVISVAFSHDGHKLVTGGEDETARVWDVATGRQLLLFGGHAGRVRSVAFSRDGERILTASQEGTATVWNASDGKEALSLEHAGIIFAAAFSPDGRQVVTSSRISNSSRQLRVAVWDTLSGEQLRVLEEVFNGPGTSAVAYSRDGQRIAAIAEHDTIKASAAVKVWDAVSHRELWVWRSANEFYSLDFSPDGQRLLTGGSGEAVVWNVATGERSLSLQGGNQLGVLSVAYSPDGKKIVTAGGDQRVILWDASSGKELFRLFGHRAAVQCVAFSPDGTRVATASGDGTVKVWDTHEVQNPRTMQIRTASEHPLAAAVNMLAYSSDGTRVATTVADRSVRIWEVATGRELLVLSGHVDEVTRIAFSPDGQRIATGNGSHARLGGQDQAKIWDCSTGRELLALDGNGFVAFSPDGRRIATSSGDRTAVIWDATSGEELVTLEGHSGWVTFGAFSPDGQRIATSSRDPTVKVWDADTGRLLLTIKGGDRWINSSALTYSPDSKRIALVNSSHAPRIYDASTGRELLALSGHTSWVTSVAFSPDGKRLLTASHDRSAKVWDAFTGRELLTLEGHTTRQVGFAAFSPDGKRVATAGYDGLLKIWEAASAEQVFAWREEEHAAKRGLQASLP